MTTGDFLFAGNSPQSFTGAASATQTMPAWWQDATKALITQGSAIAAQPYPLYQGPRVAPTSSLQNQSYDMARNLPNVGTGTVQQGAGLLGNVGQGFDSAEYNKYLDPYLKGANSEIGSLTGLATQNLTENILPAINQGFIGSGMYGLAGKNGVPSRYQTFTEQALKNANTALLNAQGGVLNNAYNNAMGSYGTGQGQRLQAGTNLGALGQIQNNMALQDMQAINALGGQQQGQTQANLNTAYGDFQNQAAYPQNQLNQLSALIHGYAPEPSKSIYQTQPLSTGTQTLAGQGYGANNGLGALGLLSMMGQ